MKAVMLSIHPKWCEKIIEGQKTIEVRKTRPKLETPFKCYIYCTKEKTFFNRRNGFFYTEEKDILSGLGVGLYKLLGGTVIGEFVCDEIFPIQVFENRNIKDYNYNALWDSCLEYSEIADYIGTEKTGYGWRISKLKTYEKARELSEFIIPCKHRQTEYECICPRNELLCLCFDVDMNPDGSVNIYVCKKPKHLERPPESWCYVEELTK